MAQTPAIRTVHHLSCTGGTLMSKCLAVCGDPYLISEVNPAAGAGPLRFAPLDIIGQLQSQYKCLRADDRQAHFAAQLALLGRIAARDGKAIVLRDHAHSDYLLGRMPEGSSLRRALDALGLARIGIATLRHPLDAFIAMELRGWARPSGGYLDSYAAQVSGFVDHCARDGLELLRYEDFCRDPDRVLRRLCAILDLPFNPDFRKTFARVRLTGDSGRGSDRIDLRPRRPVDPALAEQARSATVYRSLCRRLGYDPDPDAPALADAHWQALQAEERT